MVIFLILQFFTYLLASVFHTKKNFPSSTGINYNSSYKGWINANSSFSITNFLNKELVQ